MQKFGIRKLSDSFCTLCLAIVYQIVLNWIYETYVSIVYGYTGFVNDFSMSSFIISVIALISTFPFFNIFLKDSKRISSIVISLFYYISFMPFLTLYAYNVVDSDFFKLFFIYWVVLLISSIIFSHIQPEYWGLRLPKEKTIFFLCLFFSFIVFFIFGYYRKFDFYFGITEVYNLRSSANNFNMPSILTYLLGFARGSLPIFLIYYLINRNKKMIVLIIIVQLANFSIDGMKTVLFITVLTIIVGLFFSDSYLKKMPTFAVVFLVFAKILGFIRFDYILSLIIRRMFFDPNLISFYYYDYSKIQEPYYYQNLLRFFGVGFNNFRFDRLIGEIYFNAPSMGANTGLFGDAYRNLGWAGVFIMPILIALILFILDGVSKGLKIKIYLISAIQFGLALISSSLPTVFLTHGFLVNFLIIWLIPRPTDKHAMIQG